MIIMNNKCNLFSVHFKENMEPLHLNKAALQNYKWLLEH